MAKGAALQAIWDNLSDERKQVIHARTDDLKADYLALNALRKAAGLTQVKVSEILDMPQSNVSRLEKSADMLLSTLRAYVEATGGKLSLTVELPGKKPIILSGLGDLIEKANSDDG